MRNSKALSIRNNFLSLLLSWKAKTGKIAFVPVQLVKQDNIGFSILDVFIEVGDCSVGVRVFEVVIEPTENELIRRKFEKIREFLVFAFQPYEERIFLEVDSLSSLKFDDLPNEPEDDVFAFVHDEVGANVNDNAADGFGGLDGEVEIDVHVENVKWLFNDNGPLIDGVMTSQID